MIPKHPQVCMILGQVMGLPKKQCFGFPSLNLQSKLTPSCRWVDISTLGGFTFWQKCESYKVHLICSTYNLSIDGNEN